MEYVYAVHSPYWPVEATEWITRRRLHGFPSKSGIIKVVKYGCDFVQVSHNMFTNDNEWRFSFSRAEMFIIKSWSTSQRIVYTSLWVLNKMIGKSNLCSYYFKTLMFWACEEKPAQYWRLVFNSKLRAHNVLVDCIYELLIEMIQFAKSKFCMNYFVPGNNMMDHLFDTNLSDEIDA